MRDWLIAIFFLSTPFITHPAELYRQRWNKNRTTSE
jgi:hypothetical protein